MLGLHGISVLPISADFTHYEVAADPGSYAITGTTATLLAAKVIAVGAGSYAITGTTAALERGYYILAESAVYFITGSAAALIPAAQYRNVANITVADTETITIQTATPTLTVISNHDITINTATPEFTVH